MNSVRLDRWLWAARFFKTRSQAKSAINGGHVRLNGKRAKAAREVKCGDALNIRRGREDFTVEIEGLSDRRGGAAEAAVLIAKPALRWRSASGKEKCGELPVCNRRTGGRRSGIGGKWSDCGRVARAAGEPDLLEGASID